MPRFDRTGPQGEGPRTGRRMGKCNESSEFTGFQRGRGNRQQRGFCRQNFNTQEEEIALLKAKIESLENQMNQK
ncbi:MAG: DUF5320 domain-containing protein [Clostridia bacterium]|nr:DUF5320 domain-containing protein [Clostridia bacterium]